MIGICTAEIVEKKAKPCGVRSPILVGWGALGRSVTLVVSQLAGAKWEVKRSRVFADSDRPFGWEVMPMFWQRDGRGVEGRAGRVEGTEWKIDLRTPSLDAAACSSAGRSAGCEVRG